MLMLLTVSLFSGCEEGKFKTKPSLKQNTPIMRSAIPSEPYGR